jgi:predicted transcriptional regulator of viral defense system
MARSPRQTARTLLTQALQQGGYFTAKQARQAGYDYPHLEYHLSTGTFERIDHGLYRLTSLPPAENDDLIRLSLWSRNRQDAPQAVVSHESALVVHELTELLPGAVHLTVPPKFRKDPPQGSVLHKAVLAPEDVEERTGFRVTTPLRTLLDVAAGGLSREQLDQAVAEALERGLVRQRKLVESARRDRCWAGLRQVLEDRGVMAPETARQETAW